MKKTYHQAKRVKILAGIIAGLAAVYGLWSYEPYLTASMAIGILISYALTQILADQEPSATSLYGTAIIVLPCAPLYPPMWGFPVMLLLSTFALDMYFRANEPFRDKREKAYSLLFFYNTAFWLVVNIWGAIHYFYLKTPWMIEYVESIIKKIKP